MERDSEYVVLVSFQLMLLRAVFGTPDAHDLIEAAGGQPLAVCRDGQRANPALVRLLVRPDGLRVAFAVAPGPQLAPRIDRIETVSLAGKRHGLHPAVVAFQRRQ